MKRAITLGGGGPAAGLHIGVLDFFEKETTITFDVWALSCIGAWVGIVYNQWENGSKADQTLQFFRNSVFRGDDSYARFPINTVFGPDWMQNGRALIQYLLSPSSYYHKLVLPRELTESYQQTWSFWNEPAKWTEGDFNQWTLNNFLAINPIIRFWTSMMYLSNINGLSRIYYPNSTFMKQIDFASLSREDKPCIFHNAWNLTTQKLELFYNRPISKRNYGSITAASLCACSALPFVEETVKLNGATYCEGALVDTVNFRNLLEDHFDLDEIWINRIVDATQVHAPQNLHDSLGNLCELFAATIGEDDVKLFKYHVKEPIEIRSGPFKGTKEKWKGTIVEIQVNPYINFKWTHSNLEEGRRRGYEAAKKAHERYYRKTKGQVNATGEVRIINQKEKSEVKERRMRQ